MHDNLNARRYINDILRPNAIPFLHNQGPGVTFQHDNARHSFNSMLTQRDGELWRLYEHKKVTLVIRQDVGTIHKQRPCKTKLLFGDS